MTSVDSNFIFLCGRPQGTGPVIFPLMEIEMEMEMIFFTEMAMITILKLNFKFNHTIDITGVPTCTSIFGLSSPSFNVYLRLIYPSQLAVTNFLKTLSFYSVRLLVCTFTITAEN